MPTPEERRADAVRAEAAGRRQRFVFFWKEAALSPGCLSQFWPAPFVVDGVTYPAAEYWMMAEKARLFGDGDVLETILTAPTPAAAKAAGRAVRGYSESAWEAARYEVVVVGNLAKFTQHENLGRYLVSTGDRVLVEASPLDRVWGIGLAADDPRALNPDQWQGLNLLGQALMEAREVLRK
jgi:ribA/ribD-fused uncharacterized protein